MNPLCLGLDPGLRISGYALLDESRQSPGSVIVSGVLDNDVILEQLLHAYAKEGTQLAVEEVAGQGPKRMGLDELRTARWSGRFEQRWASLCKLRDVLEPFATPFFITRNDVRVHLVGRGNVKNADSVIRRVLIDRWGGDEAAFGPKGQAKKKGFEPVRGPLYGISSHAWQALAVAVVASERARA